MRSLSLLIMATLALSIPVQALDLTVEECVTMGLHNNPALQAQQAMVESAHWDTRIARAAYLPTLEAQGTYAALDQPERIIIANDLVGAGFPLADTEIRDDREVYGAGLTLRQTLYAGGRITHTYQRDTELLASARHEYGNHQTQLAYELKRTFYEILIHQHYRDSYSQQLLARQEGLRIATALADEGQLGRDKLDQARAQLLFSEAELMAAQQREANSLDQLRRLLALDNHEEIRLVDMPTYPVLKNPYQALGAIAIANRQDLKQLEARIRAAEESLHVAKSRYQPEVFAQGGYIRQRETNLTRADNWGASINFNWPLFEGGKTSAEAAKAKAEQQRLINLRRDLAAAIDNEVLAAQRRAQQKQLLAAAYEVNLQAEERIYRDILERRKQGEVLSIDQVEQKATLFLARANYLESILQLRIAVAALEAALAAPAGILLDSKDIYQAHLSQTAQPPRRVQPGADAAADPTIPFAGHEPPKTLDKPPARRAQEFSYSVQLGAFKTEERALAHLNTLERQYPDKKFKLIADRGFHKIRSAPSRSHAEAVSALKAFNGKGFIVRVNTTD